MSERAPAGSSQAARPVTSPLDRFPGAVLLIQQADGARWLLQRKDDQHPTVAARGRLSLWGGSVQAGETPEQALQRELAEEFAEPRLVAELLGHSRYRRRFQLSAEPWPGEYALYVFEATVDAATFGRWARQVVAPGVVREGVPVVLEAAELRRTLATPAAFLASQQLVIEALRSGR